tara:strand:+ start:255 stop:434 length:180 start_codon:yes stop_codon:yes gene_type:complete
MKACKNCRAINDGSKCWNCGSTNFANSFKGKVVILDAEHSQIAKKMSILKPGEYAVKVL